MQAAVSAMGVVFVALVALWPLAWLAAIVRHAMHKRWKPIGQLALLLPLWTIAASVGAVQLGPLLKAVEAAQPSPSLVVRGTGLAVAVCIAVVAWLLLLRSFRPSPTGAVVRD